MGWGWRITILYSSFVVFMIGMAVMAFRQDFDLVSDDYYEEEIAYQGRIDQMTNASEDHQKVKCLSAISPKVVPFLMYARHECPIHKASEVPTIELKAVLVQVIL